MVEWLYIMSTLDTGSLKVQTVSSLVWLTFSNWRINSRPHWHKSEPKRFPVKLCIRRSILIHFISSILQSLAVLILHDIKCFEGPHPSSWLRELSHFWCCLIKARKQNNCSCCNLLWSRVTDCAMGWLIGKKLIRESS